VRTFFVVQTCLHRKGGTLTKHCNLFVRKVATNEAILELKCFKPLKIFEIIQKKA